MRQITLIVLAGILVFTSSASAETPPFVDAAFVYGFGTDDYVDAGKAEKRSARLNHYSRANNLESFVITFQARRAFGDLAYRPGFFYALNPLVIEGGNGVRLHMRRLAKYPDLVQRYNAIRPASVEAVISVVAECHGYGQFTKGSIVFPRLYFKITALDFVYGNSRDGKDRSSPVVPLHLKDRVSLDHSSATRFTSEDRTTDEELRNIFANLIRITDKTANDSNDVNVDLKITWPDFEIEQIAKDFERYEKDGKKAEKDYAFLKDAPKEKPYSGNEEMALPIDASPKPGEAFEGRPTPEAKWRAGIRVGDKVIVESENIVGKPKPLDEKKTLFLVQMRDELGARIMNTKGKWIEYAGYSRFLQHHETKDLIGVPDSLTLVYTSRYEYSSYGTSVSTEQEFNRFRDYDQKPPAPKKPEPETKRDYTELQIVASTYLQDYFRAERIILDATKKKVVSKQPAYISKPRYNR